MLKVENLSIHFEDRSEREEVVKNVSFAVENGDILGIVGESGSGKTMTALTIAGLLKKHAVLDGGRVWLDDTDLLGLSEKEMRRVQGNEISMIFQEPMTALNPTMRIGKQVEEALLLHSRRRRRDRGGRLRMERREQRELALRALEEVELEHPEQLYKKYPHELSGGMRQRVMIAAAIVCRPKLLIADEPTTALDVRTQESILQLLKKLNRKYGMSILFISHNLRVVNTLCRRVLVMKDGQVVEEGDCAEIFENPQSEYTRELIAAIPARTRENRYYELLRRRKKAGEGFAGKDFGSEACKCLL
ncbi:ABC transporter ATP-binding protein [Schaedlerella sp.]|jgi:peptide/nickel transport system ATP-binding protein|uniref:ABC transporter ATP-binding protein n=1 Tax=Schaedlerella sp. TaxID=2676057 RepID=UPI0013645AF9|nr:ABC transporter ATP-binding protein [uncultured Schaedlerella sp.]MCI8767074.1 ABC transporter ATP-binding protein [Ruminococcus sp.]MCI9328648.1 ABC transporter ATP-binding protein [Ruminococcus sp.]NBI98646.1 ABC transporter ATP-binding protein [Lachnospiraceae bacterium]